VKAPRGPEWARLTELGSTSSAPLEAAFLTTYEPPDSSLLVEELLPAWLGLEAPYSGDGPGQLRFYTELVGRLKSLHGRFVVVSSAAQTNVGPLPAGSEDWLWNHVQRLEVGAHTDATQHAKLWLLHWGRERDSPERLEVVVSSANLTRSALHSQLQAGWRCLVDLADRGSTKRRDGWGLLAPFLERLGRACGNRGSESVEYWLRLLRRADCPQGVTFVASVQGDHAMQDLRRQAWGAEGLRHLWQGRGRRRMTIVVPTVGMWNEERLRKFGERAGVGMSDIQLAWIDKEHRWAGRWSMPRATGEALRVRANGEAGPIELGAIANPDQPACDKVWRSPYPSSFTSDDRRWPHCKLYELLQGRDRRLLVTSANFSAAAWGHQAKRNAITHIQNFELGVAFRSEKGLGRHLSSRNFIPAAQNTTDEDVPVPDVRWASAEWNGHRLRVQYRVGPGVIVARRIQIVVERGEPCVRSVAWTGRSLRTGVLQWRTSSTVPLMVHLHVGIGGTRPVPVVDVRPASERQQVVCSRLDPKEAEELLARLAEERYGYRLADGPGSRTTPTTPRGSRHQSDSYDVAAYVDARRRFQWIDAWRAHLEAAQGEVARAGALEDGRRVLARWERQAETWRSGAPLTPRSKATQHSNLALAVALAAKELRRWLKDA
jgi:hypothetical protein